MKKYFSDTLSFLLLFTALFSSVVYSQVRVLDEFESVNDWTIFKSDGVDAEVSLTQGISGNAIVFDYDFTKGSGYGGIQKLISLDLPENYQFSFYLKAESPNNNFEVKFLDASGENVWWVNNRNYEFPTEWKKIIIKKRHINFAWGPTNDQSLNRIDRIEFTIASFTGGKGKIIIDSLTFENLPPINLNPSSPILTSSGEYSSDYSINNIADGNLNTRWMSKISTAEEIIIDFQQYRELGGFVIDWDKEMYPKTFQVFLSNDRKNWEKVYSSKNNKGGRSYIRLTDAEARYAKLSMSESNKNSFAISELKTLNPENSENINHFFINIAKDYPRGYFPRYFYEEKTYWNIIGVNSDVKEALINEDGMVEIEKAQFSIEPVIQIEDKFFNWNGAQITQTLVENYLPIPKVEWICEKIKFEIKAFASGVANRSSVLYLKYTATNNSIEEKDGNLYLLIRPFQVNPYYQSLNLEGGVGKIISIKEDDGKIYVNDDKVILPVTNYTTFGTAAFDEGNIIDALWNNNIPQSKSVIDPTNLASGVLQYDFNLKPGEEKVVYLAVPFYGEETLPENLNAEMIEQKLVETKNFWESKVNYIKFNLPKSADKIINTWKSNLAYILINRDNAGIQPGSRSYERSWIRDGSLTSSALLKSGIVDEVKEFIEWYAAHQYENGKVPCVVDSRGPDPVPEHDSHGQLIYLIKEYFNFTRDTAFLRSKNENVLKAVGYIESLIAERSTDHFKYGNDSVRAYYGLVTESISHEGYSAKPMHSYWDNFFIIKGLKDAAEIQLILGEKENYERVKKIRDIFSENLYNSLNLAMKVRGIDYIPGCVELGDFDATSTTIALTPCNELNNLPKPQVYNTFEKYYEFFKNRRDGKIDWVNYTPYENRLIGSFIYLDQPERAHELIKYFLNDQRPRGWNHWAEVVWKDERHPGFIGDMPHTWVGSDFINAVRSMFVYESASGGEDDSSLVIGAALYQDWIDSPDGMSVENLPTYYGELSYSIKKENDEYHFSIYGDVKLPKDGIKIKNFNGSKLPHKVIVNGNETKAFTKNEIDIKELPVEVVISY